MRIMSFRVEELSDECMEAYNSAREDIVNTFANGSFSQDILPYACEVILVEIQIVLFEVQGYQEV